MAEDRMREELLKQNGTESVERELAGLRQLIEAEQKRVRSLSRWTKSVWLVILLLIAAGIGGLLVAKHSARNPRAGGPLACSSPASAPSATRSAVADSKLPAPTPGAHGVLAVGGIVILLLSLLIPLGIILLIVLSLARRRATTGQIQVGIASIEAHLRMLARGQTQPGSDKPDHPS